MSTQVCQTFDFDSLAQPTNFFDEEAEQQQQQHRVLNCSAAAGAAGQQNNAARFGKNRNRVKRRRAPATCPRQQPLVTSVATSYCEGRPRSGAAHTPADLTIRQTPDSDGMPQAEHSPQSITVWPAGHLAPKKRPPQQTPPAVTRRELSVVFYLFQNLCWKFQLGTNVMQAAQQILMEQYRQHKRARNLALAAVCCIIHACEQSVQGVQAPPLREALDYSTSVLERVLGGRQANGQCAPSPIRRRLTQRQTIIHNTVRLANEKLRRARAAAVTADVPPADAYRNSSSGLGNVVEERKASPTILMSEETVVPLDVHHDDKDCGVFGTSPDSPIAAAEATDAANCDVCTTYSPAAEDDHVGMDTTVCSQACKRRCVMRLGKPMRKVCFGLEANTEVHFESDQSVQGFGFSLAADAAMATAANLGASPKLVATAANDDEVSAVDDDDDGEDDDDEESEFGWSRSRSFAVCD